MNSLDDILALICSNIKKECGVDVYAVIPDDCPLPFVRLSQIRTQRRLIYPNIHEAEISITVFSEAYSLKEAITIAEKAVNIIEVLGNDKSSKIVYSRSTFVEVQQLKNSLIAAETTAIITYEIN